MAKESVKVEAAEKQEAIKQETKMKTITGNKPVYKVNELAAKARQIFGTTPEIVTVALNSTGKETATVEEAKAIIKVFLEREVN